MPTDIGYDDYGYYDLDTGADVLLEYDEYGRAYNALTGQEVGGIVNAARDVLIGIFGRQGYPPPQGYPRGAQYPRQFPQDQYYPQRQGSGGGSGINISTNTLMLIVGGVVLFMLGRRR